MSFILELNKLPLNIRPEIRKLENIKGKIIKNKWSQIFNEICIKEINKVQNCKINISIYPTLPFCKYFDL